MKMFYAEILDLDTWKFYLDYVPGISFPLKFSQLMIDNEGDEDNNNTCKSKYCYATYLHVYIIHILLQYTCRQLYLNWFSFEVFPSYSLSTIQCYPISLIPNLCLSFDSFWADFKLLVVSTILKKLEMSMSHEFQIQAQTFLRVRGDLDSAFRICFLPDKN